MSKQSRAEHPIYNLLPTEIEGFNDLAELALDMRWSWNHATDEVWRKLAPELWEVTHNPWVVLQTVSRDQIEMVLADPVFCRKVDSLLRKRRQAAKAPAWFQENHAQGPLTCVAYFSMEFMLSEALPIYSGGLGNVAGDQFKAASDLGVPVIGVGLLYQQGYFRQVLDLNGAQQALYPYNDPGQLPITPLRQELGGGSLTALPIIETEAQNISAYIPTNLISITDGQIYLSPTLFELGVLPAVDVGKSVSRVGGKAQRAAYRAVAGDLKLAYAQFEERESFSRFGARLDEEARHIIEHGRRIRACLQQSELSPVPMPAQIAVLLALSEELFDDVPLARMPAAEKAVREAAAEIPAEVRDRLDTAAKLSDDDRESIIQIARQALTPFLTAPESGVKE